MEKTYEGKRRKKKKDLHIIKRAEPRAERATDRDTSPVQANEVPLKRGDQRGRKRKKLQKNGKKKLVERVRGWTARRLLCEGVWFQRVQGTNVIIKAQRRSSIGKGAADRKKQGPN